MARYIDADKLKTRIAPESDFRHTLVEWIDLQETEDVAPVIHAHWEYVKSIDYEWDYPWMCSECGSCSQWETDYCKDCGAKMDEEVE